jgi:succinoglycan biosynthesis transport protein ExoP
MQNGRAIAHGHSDGGPSRHLAPADNATPLRGVPGAGSYGEEPPSEDLRSLLFEGLRILFKRKWLILAIAIAVVAIGAMRSLMITPMYTATVRIQIDARPIKIVEGGQVESADNSYEFLRTQIELLRSTAVAERVVSLARLADDPDFFKPREFSLLAAIGSLLRGAAAKGNSEPDRAALAQTAAYIVAANQSVRIVHGSRIVDVSYTDPAPARAQRVANVYADAFIASNLDKRFQANVYAKAFLEDQLAQLKVRLEEAEQTVIAFAEKEEFVITSEKSSIAESNLTAANAALGGVISERIKAEQMWRQVENVDALNLPQFLLNPVIQGLRATRNTLDGEYKEKLQTFKPGYPVMVQLQSRMREIDRQIVIEVKAIKESHKAAYEQTQQQESEMRARIESLRLETLDLQRRSIQYNNLKREANTLRTLYEGMLQRHKEVDVAGGTGANNIFVVDKASPPGTPSSPNLSRALLMSLMLGLGGGFGVAFLLERLDDAIRAPDQLERLTGAPTLGVIPNVGKDAAVEDELLNPRSSVAEAYRSLCTALQFSTDEGLPRSLIITSSVQAEGKSITSLAIARHFANMGLRVLIVDADLRNPSLHQKLNLGNSIGLSNYLTGERLPPQTFQATDIDKLTFMATGPLPPNAADLLSGPRLFSLLSVGAETFDLIVIDCPPVMGLADAPLLSNAAAATVFVVGAGQSRPGQIRGALKRLQFARSPIVGTVLTKSESQNAPYGYEYGYGYGYGYGAKENGGQISGSRGQHGRLTQA